MDAMDAALAAREAYNRVHTQLDIDHEMERQERRREVLLDWEQRMIEQLRVEPAFADEEPCIGTCQSCGMYWDTRYVSTCPAPCNGYVG